MNQPQLVSQILTKNRDRTTSVLSVLTLALPHAVFLTVVAGLLMFIDRYQRAVTPISDDGSYLMMAATATCLVVMPVLSMSAAAARLGLSRMAKDLAIMRLVGLGPRQAKIANMLTVLRGALWGIALGTLLYLATMPSWQLLSFQGKRIELAEMWMGLPFLIACSVVILVIAACSAWLAMRKVVISPLGVVKNTNAPKVPLVGVALFFILLATWLLFSRLFMKLSEAVMWTVVLSFISALLLLLNAVGVFSISVLGRIIAGAASKPSTLVAGRRIVDDPRAQWRSYGAVGFVVFIVVLLYPIIGALTLIESTESATMGENDLIMVQDIKTGMLITLGFTFALAAISTTINQTIRMTDIRSQTESLVKMGVPSKALHSIRRREVFLPLLTILATSMALGFVFSGGAIQAAPSPAAIGATVGSVILGACIVLLASELAGRLVRG